MRNKQIVSTLLALLLLAGLLAGCGGNKEADQEKNSTQNTGSVKDQVVNIYTARHYESDEKLFKQFTENTGIKVNIVSGKAEELIERLKREGKDTEADLFITVDGGVLNEAKEAGVLQPVSSEKIDANVPKNLRDKENYWIGLSTRARVIVYSKDRVKPEDLSTYEDLTSERWKGKVLVRSSTSLYNQSLLASFIAIEGEQKAEEWARGIVNNLAKKPEGGDRDQAKAIAAGIGDVAIMNTYYVGLLHNSADPEEVKVAEQLGVFFPNQESTGTHINISGIGLTKYSKNKENAIKLIEFLTDPEAQTELSISNFEFPVNKKAEMPELLKSWGEFKAQDLDFSMLGVYNRKAIEIFNKVGWQ